MTDEVLEVFGADEPPSVVGPPIEEWIAPFNHAPLDWQTDAPPSNWQAQRLEVQPSAELERIKALPRRKPPEPGSIESLAMVRLMTARFSKHNDDCQCAQKGWHCIKELREVQAWALYELGLYGAIFGFIGTGFGKTLLNILAMKALESRGVKTGCLLIPPTLMLQLIHNYQQISQHFHVPSLIVHGRGETYRSFTVPGCKTFLHVFPYSRLKLAENTTWLETLAPDVIIADECDYLKNVETATWSRVGRALGSKPTIFLPWSGSPTGTSITEYWHLIACALGLRSPLPTDKDVVIDWARAIDPSDNPAPAGALEDLYTEPGQSLYDAFYSRIMDTPGVIHTKVPSLDIPLHIAERDPGALPPNIKQALTRLREEWVRPDDMAPGHIEGAPCEEFTSALEVQACAVQLACGFFYRWKYPRGEPRELILKWLTYRALWNREVRYKVKERREFMDSELLCRQAAMRYWGDLPKEPGADGIVMPVWKSEHWPAWRDIADQVKPETEAILISDFLAEDAAAWAQKEKGIVWYDHRAFGRRVAELADLPLHGGGPNAGTRILAERGNRSIVASINSHGRGRDGLQRLFATQLVAQPPSSPDEWEQMLARLSRPGQKAPSVSAVFYRHTEELDKQVHRAIKRAEYVRGTTGTAQKLLDAWGSGRK